MKLKAIFEYTNFCHVLARSKGFHGFEDEFDELKEKIEASLFEPEFYKEVTGYEIPVEPNSLSESVEGVEEIANLMNDFANENNIETIFLTRDLNELTSL